MSLRISLSALLALTAAFRGYAADDDSKAHVKEALQARMAEDAKKKAAAPVSPTTAAAPAKAEKKESPAPAPAPASAPAAKDAPNTEAKPADQSPTVLPKVEVKKDRITELDQKLQKQGVEMARELKNTKPTEVDKALNDPKVSKALAIFGGESSQYRANVAKERLSMMDEERDLMEEIAHANTKEERQELQKQLDDLKALRRQLEKTLK